MQLGPAAMFDELLGKDVEARARDANADLAVVEMFFERAWKTLRIAEQPAPLTDPQRVELVGTVVKELYAARQINEAVFFGLERRDEVLKHRVAFRQMGNMLRSLLRTKELHELAEVDLGPDATEEMQHAQYEVRLRNGVGPNVADYVRNWGPIRSSFDAALADLRIESAKTVELARQAHALMVVRQERVLSKDEFIAKLAWGRVAGDFLLFLSRFNTGWLLWRKAESQSSDVKQIMALAEEAKRMFAPGDMSAIHRRRDEGRSILFAEKHAGCTTFRQQFLNKVGLPDTLVAANSPTRFDLSGKIAVGLRGDFRKDFMKLVKIVKRNQRLIRIFPDGPAGEQRETPFLGTTVPIGLGGEMLAWQSNAAVFSTGSTWRGGRLSMTVAEGPVVDRDADREVFEEAFYSFYAAELEKVALGPPEDVANKGGIWRDLVNKFADTPLEKGTLS